MINTILLLEKINNSGFKRSFIAQKLGISRATLHNKMKGFSEFSLGEVSILCELLKIVDLTEKDHIFFAQK